MISTPAYLLWVGMAHVQALPFATIAFQGLVQGGLQGAFTMVAYGQAVVLLGVSRAVLFPAIVPALSVLLGIPIVGEIPGFLQIAGLALVTLGLMTTVGAIGLLIAAFQAPKDHIELNGRAARRERPGTLKLAVPWPPISPSPLLPPAPSAAAGCPRSACRGAC